MRKDDCKIDAENIGISVKKITGSCPHNFSVGQKFSLSEILPDGLCLHAFHTFFPYYLTIKNGGWFDWVKPGDGVCVHCPHPDGIVAKIYKEGSGNGVIVRVINNPKDCFCAYSANQEFKLDNFKFCPRALDAFYPYLLKHKNGSFLIGCPSDNNNVVFEITK